MNVTGSVGLLILATVILCGRGDARTADAPVTFTEHIASIVSAHCAACHTPGGVAPFSLLTYADLRARARQVVGAVTRRSMPPWKPEPGFGEFAGARRLSDDQISLFTRWVDGGSRLGNARALVEAA